LRRKEFAAADGSVLPMLGVGERRAAGFVAKNQSDGDGSVGIERPFGFCGRGTRAFAAG
jgi:hypothetical protein